LELLGRLDGAPAWYYRSHPQRESIDAMRVTVVTAKTTVKDERGRKVDGIVLQCTRCAQTVEVFGTSDASVKRGFVKLREGCEEKGRHFYVEEELQREPSPAPPQRSAAE
jgi:hypothetical protein